jgi:hypothetical protein
MKKIASGFFAAFVLAFVVPAIAAGKNKRGVDAEVVSGVVERHTLTLKLRDGTTKTFAVKGNVSLDYADDGDEVRITIEKDRITSISVVKERK